MEVCNRDIVSYRARHRGDEKKESVDSCQDNM